MKAFLFLSALATFTASAPVTINRRATNQVFSATQAAANNVYDGIGAGLDNYKLYTGDGSASAGWPSMTEWVSFQQMFDSNAELMKVGCTNLGLAPGSDTTNEEIADLYDAIQSVASTSDVDHRFILAIIMQESLGCVRVYTTANANANPGLMQDHAGLYSCNPASQGVSGSMMFPCPYEQIEGMIQEGTSGTQAGDGLAGYLNAVVGRAASVSQVGMDGSNAQVYYQGGRYYNSGNVDYNELGNGFSSRNCYASDIANRLTGWTSTPKQCWLDG